MLAHLAPAHAYGNGIAAALLDALEAPAQTPIAPLAALGGDFDAGNDYVIAADPVLLAADRDDLVLVQRVDDLSAAEAATLVALLNRHFDADGLQFAAVHPDAWFARSTRVPAMTTTPFDAARLRGIFPFLPQGADAGLWQRWQNEIGMLLHEHPVNEARQAAGSAPVTGIWFSGGGRLADTNAMPRAIVHAAPGRIADLARGIAPQDGCATFGRDHAVDRELVHQDAIADRDAQRSTTASLAVHDHDDRRVGLHDAERPRRHGGDGACGLNCGRAAAGSGVVGIIAGGGEHGGLDGRLGRERSGRALGPAAR